MSALNTPPLNRMCVGRIGPFLASPCAVRNAARWRVIAVSDSNGKPISRKPLARRRAGFSETAHAGKNPSNNIAVAALRSRSTEIVPPINLLPRPRIVTGCFLGPPSAKSVSLAARQACHSETDCQGSSVDALVLERAAHLMGQRQIHVVAADKDVIADRDSPQR